MNRVFSGFALFTLLALPLTASTGEPTAEDLLKRYDQVMKRKDSSMRNRLDGTR